MTFLGPTTKLGGSLVRPHDIDVHTHGTPGAVAGRIVRQLRVGFEVRLTVQAEDGTEIEVTVTRATQRALDLHDGAQVWLTPTTGIPRAEIAAV